MEDSFLNLAHFHSRRAENHLKKRRFDLAIEHHKKTVDLLNKAIEQSSIEKNIECLILQRNYHEKYQHIVLMKKVQFFHDIMVQRERLKSTERENSLNRDLKSGTDDELNNFVGTDGDDDAFSPSDDDRRLMEDLPPLELPEFDFGNFEIK
ncbi:uncharacterized protein LOC119071291 [Bradysia coprophila]|uniref:uncharacterized protein LOC119071291 n=1 Tax=Bradysia coprophila TaxID=38358 RepID=UPI00187DA945|nr:uncharacterized protein LOC119071291 [Bradysia coprophila]